MIAPAGETTSVVLVTMPYAHIMRPSLALGILKSCLREAGITCRVHYANLEFAAWVGIAVNSFMMQLRTDSLLGEWTFAGAAFRQEQDNLEDIIGAARSTQPPNIPAAALDERKYARVFRQLRALAPEFVEKTATSILQHHPRIVGCTSTFEQHCPSLALLRRIKEMDPTVVTLMGGANCESEMGWATLKNCPWVDGVVSGEADEIMAPLCQMFLDGRAGDLAAWPLGAMGRRHVAAGRAAAFPLGRLPRAVVQNMQHSPAPDFDEFFSALAASPLQSSITPALAVESSRGCWWGQKSHCTFCGLNGTGMNYRSKKADQVLHEWQVLATRYAPRKMTVVDNIIDHQHIKELLPRLAEAGAPYELFYETKANLRREQVRLMREAGVTKIQPGIEALHDDLLRLMAKGNSAAINIQVLKFARDYGLMTTWMLLVGFPGENPAWHKEVAAWLPLVYHLQPPNGMVHIRYDRFSVYFNEAQRFGLNLRPFPGYAAVYPFPEEELRDVAYFFYDADRPQRTTPTPQSVLLGQRVTEWIRAYQRPVPAVFCCDDDGAALHFFDTRPCAPVRRSTLTGRARELYLACDTAIRPTTLLDKTCGTDPSAPERTEAKEILRDLVDRKFLLLVHDQLLALATLGSAPVLGSQRDFPNGYVEKFDPSEHPDASTAWRELQNGSPRIDELLSHIATPP